MNMDLSESTKIVYNRIQKLEPENVSKIIGYLLLQEDGEQDMIRLANGPDNLIHSFINKAKKYLESKSANFSPGADVPINFAQVSPRTFPTLSVGNIYWDTQVPPKNRSIQTSNFLSVGYSNPMTNERQLPNQLQSLSLDDHSDNRYFSQQSRRSEFPVKVCRYFNKGCCKKGNNCKYFHSFNNELGIDEHIFSSVSLKKLEMELTELLKSKRGLPVSIASLPMLYYVTFGKTLQAEGYLTESQRHGKAGYSLTKLLARLRSSIRVIDRPHGQHAVILAEDIPKYMVHSGKINEHGAIVAGSRQIYLTFLAKSTFSEQDVCNYFNQFGPVQDVRIPCQQKRMFGFVTFVFPETVKQILAKGNPHLVCGACVVVKPYREKSKLEDRRKYVEKAYQTSYYSSSFNDTETEHQSSPRVCEDSRLLKKHFIEEHKRAIEFERCHFSELQHHQMRVGYPVDDLKVSLEGHREKFQLPEDFTYLVDVWNNSSASDESQ